MLGYSRGDLRRGRRSEAITTAIYFGICLGWSLDELISGTVVY
jgi:hypothetical protein